MNNLSKKEEMHIEKKAKALSSNTAQQKKLESYLLLLYQGYLKGETDIALETREAFLSFVKQDEDLALKVRMLQLDLLNLENIDLEGEWNETTEELFPKIDFVDTPVEEHRTKALTDYKETILEILESLG